LKNGQSRIQNQIAWARYILAKTGYIDASNRGIWTLTEKGLKETVEPADALTLVKQVRRFFAQKGTERAEAERDESPLVTESPYPDHRAELLSLLRSLHPSGFERLCQRLLRENGFQEVTVTGRSGNGGIDGHGVVQVNPFVSFRVLFRCKRYKNVVTPSEVRDFRGAMTGRVDKGIILTTGTFTSKLERKHLATARRQSNWSTEKD
jgi:restriction system protein